MDAELVSAARGGDEGAFAALIERNLAAMRAVAVAVLGWVDEAEDVVQDAVLIALRDLPKLRDPEVMVLRYFTDSSSYRQIAEICAVPEHTVRSRLRDGRRAFSRALRDVAALTHADSGAIHPMTRRTARPR